VPKIVKESKGNGSISDIAKAQIERLLAASSRGEVLGVIISWEDSKGVSHNALEGRGDSLEFLTHGIIETVTETMAVPPGTAKH
jgi:hypothetical protein